MILNKKNKEFTQCLVEGKIFEGTKFNQIYTKFGRVCVVAKQRWVCGKLEVTRSTFPL